MGRGGWLVWGLAFGLMAAGCVIEQRRPPRRAPPPATVQPVGPDAPPPGPGAPPGAHGFHATSGPAGGAIAPGAVRGRPPGMHPGAPAAMWIWLNRRGQWRVRTTTAGQRRHFSGTVAGSTAPLQHVQPSRSELRDDIKLDQGVVKYGFQTAGHIDGFDFTTADRGCVRFALTPVDSSDSYRVFVGRNRLTPPGPDFELCP